MKNARKFVLLSGFFFGIGLMSANAQDYEVSVKNDTLLDSHHLQFDIYVKSKSSSFHYGIGQYKIQIYDKTLKFNQITPSITPFVSDLVNQVQIPKKITMKQGKEVIVLVHPPTTASIPKKQSECSVITNKGEGVRICRVILTSEVDFNLDGKRIGLLFDEPYPTKVFPMTDKNLLYTGK